VEFEIDGTFYIPHLVETGQGDQIGLCQKIAQHVAHTIFIKVNSQLLPWAKVVKKWPTYVIFNRYQILLPKENNCPIGDNSPHLVTLFST
jgi:hypothetical protein